MDAQIFEKAKKLNEYGQEYRSARDLRKILWYSEYRFFVPVIEKAKKACENSHQAINDHFEEVHDKVEIWSGAQRKISDILLSRYACYLIIQNADPTKEIVALWQTYFAIQTRKQEIGQQHLEDQKRVHLRDEVTHHNKRLFTTAKDAGVTDYANFYDYGYFWLYGMRKREIISKKWLHQKDNILDHMDSEELAANLFRATQAEAKIKREWLQGQQQASNAHYEVGKKIRTTIKELWGTMPEDIPAVEDIKHARKRLKDLEYHIEWGTIPASPIPQFTLPDNAVQLQQLVQIIKTHPGEEFVQFGQQTFRVSIEWVWMIRELLN
jgi:DNA-damage-inducible protein D